MFYSSHRSPVVPDVRRCFRPEHSFLEFRRKVRDAEVLSASMQRLLETLRFTGRLSVVVQNGRVLKSGYEEGYFRPRKDAPLSP